MQVLFQAVVVKGELNLRVNLKLETYETKAAKVSNSKNHLSQLELECLDATRTQVLVIS